VPQPEPETDLVHRPHDADRGLREWSDVGLIGER